MTTMFHKAIHCILLGGLLVLPGFSETRYDGAARTSKNLFSDDLDVPGCYDNRTLYPLGAFLGKGAFYGKDFTLKYEVYKEKGGEGIFCLISCNRIYTMRCILHHVVEYNLRGSGCASSSEVQYPSFSREPFAFGHGADEAYDVWIVRPFPIIWDWKDPDEKDGCKWELKQVDAEIVLTDGQVFRLCLLNEGYISEESEGSEGAEGAEGEGKGPGSTSAPR